MIEISKPVVFCHHVQLVRFEVFIQESGKGNRIQIRVGERNVQLFCRFPQKADVKVCIVCDHQPIADKSEKFGQYFSDLACILYHIIGDGGQLDDLLRDRHFRVDKGIIAFYDLAVFHQHRTDFGDGAGSGVFTGGLQVKNDKFVLKVAGVFPIYGACRIVDEIRFHAVNDLLTDFFGGEHGVLKALHVPVVGNGNGGVPPGICGLHGDIRGD